MRTITKAPTQPPKQQAPKHWWEVCGNPTDKPPLLHESNGEDVKGWPVRASEYLTFSPTELQKLVEKERQKPTLKKLQARLRTRQCFAINEAENLETCGRLLNEAEIEYMRPQISHYQQLRQLKAPNLQRTN